MEKRRDCGLKRLQSIFENRITKTISDYRVSLCRNLLYLQEIKNKNDLCRFRFLIPEIKACRKIKLLRKAKMAFLKLR